MNNKVVSAIIGLIVGDALGVPVEFNSRSQMKRHPVVGMQEYGTHNQPKGTWSDDSSMALCTIESLTVGYNLQDITNKFIKWYMKAYWTAHKEVFDIGNVTRNALYKAAGGAKPIDCGGQRVNDNGNGSLMRILPLAFYIIGNELGDERFNVIHDVSAITHGHIRSKIACSMYIELAINIAKGYDKELAYSNMCNTINSYYSESEQGELKVFNRILNGKLGELRENDIKSSGYVVDTLEASIWCLLTSNSYKETVLKAVNLGDDTDTVGAIAGGIAGILYGIDNIPKEWVEVIARKDDILDLCNRFSQSLG